MKSTINQLLGIFNLELRRSPNRLIRNRFKLLDTFKIDTVLDVGANIGQYASQIKKGGFKGEIHSFEPLSVAFRQLEQKSLYVPNWHVYNYGFGEKNHSTSIHVASNLSSSSIFSMKQKHIDAAPEVSYVATEEIEIKTLDAVYADLFPNNERVFIKIDTQGYESKVLLGGKESIANSIVGMQLEMSLFELYDGEWLYHDFINYLRDIGFRLYSIEPGLFNYETGELLQMDGIFFKT